MNVVVFRQISIEDPEVPMVNVIVSIVRGDLLITLRA